MRYSCWSSPSARTCPRGASTQNSVLWISGAIVWGETHPSWRSAACVWGSQASRSTCCGAAGRFQISSDRPCPPVPEDQGQLGRGRRIAAVQPRRSGLPHGQDVAAIRGPIGAGHRRRRHKLRLPGKEGLTLGQQVARPLGKPAGVTAPASRTTATMTAVAKGTDCCQLHSTSLLQRPFEALHARNVAAHPRLRVSPEIFPAVIFAVRTAAVPLVLPPVRTVDHRLGRERVLRHRRQVCRHQSLQRGEQRAVRSLVSLSSETKLRDPPLRVPPRPEEPAAREHRQHDLAEGIGRQRWGSGARVVRFARVSRPARPCSRGYGRTSLALGRKLTAAPEACRTRRACQMSRREPCR